MITLKKTISSTDRLILRELAQKQFEYSQLPIMKQREKEWIKHNNFEGIKPMLHLELGTFASEVIPQRLRCEGELARNIEWRLYSNFLNYELFDDDKLVPDHFGVGYGTYFTLFGQEISVSHATNTTGSDLGHRFNYVISDIHDDAQKLGKTKFGYTCSKEDTLQDIEFYKELFGDILPVKLEMGCLGSCPTQNIVHMMGMETMFTSMYDYPEEFAVMMSRIADDYIEYFDWLASEGLILPTVLGEGLGQGTLCYTSELPGQSELAKRPFTSKDVWGYMDSQETVGLSPEMFKEFMFPCYERIANSFGLLSYGCCEPVNSIWDSCLSGFDHLRKVSVSPWCDEEFMGERLRGRRTIYQRKPFPNYLGTGTVLDETVFKEHINKTLHAAKGCKLEITQRDVYSINHDEQKARRYIEIIRECIAENWQG